MTGSLKESGTPIALSGSARPVRESAEGLARTLLRLHAERGLEIQVRVEPEHSIRRDHQDLDEMLGNLLDNACRWARSQVVVAASATGSGVTIMVDDDGPGWTR
ncbi:MAG: hypothetical protein ACRD2I_23870 [Vicinamibacterales bacterium]